MTELHLVLSPLLGFIGHTSEFVNHERNYSIFEPEMYNFILYKIKFEIAQDFHRHSDKCQKIAAVNYCRLTTEATGHVEIGHTSPKKEKRHVPEREDLKIYETGFFPLHKNAGQLKMLINFSFI